MNEDQAIRAEALKVFYAQVQAGCAECGDAQTAVPQIIGYIKTGSWTQPG